MSTSLIFGNLTWGAIPWSNTLVMTVLAVVAVIGFSILAAITYFKKWGYLWREWLTTVDHKKLGVMYIILALVMLLRGFSDAFMMRTQLAVATGGASGYLPPEHFDQIFSAHGVIMIIFVAMPFMIGLMNLILPLQIGARDFKVQLLGPRIQPHKDLALFNVAVRGQPGFDHCTGGFSHHIRTAQRGCCARRV